MAKADWSDLVDEMREKGANATDADAQAIVAYLAKYFGPDEKKTSPPPQTHDDK